MQGVSPSRECKLCSDNQIFRNKSTNTSRIFPDSRVIWHSSEFVHLGADRSCNHAATNAILVQPHQIRALMRLHATSLLRVTQRKSAEVTDLLHV
jgi:hypothetical protein